MLALFRQLTFGFSLLCHWVYKANLKDIKELVEKKVPNFRFLYPEFTGYKTDWVRVYA